MERCALPRRSGALELTRSRLSIGEAASVEAFKYVIYLRLGHRLLVESTATSGTYERP